jgi:hypothetical protein
MTPLECAGVALIVGLSLDWLWALRPKPEIDLEEEHRREVIQEVRAEFVNADEPQPESEWDPDFELDPRAQ